MIFFPTIRRCNKVHKNVYLNSQLLKNLVLKCKWQYKMDIDIDYLDYICFLFTLELYRQVMTIKYSKFAIGSIIRTIFYK